MNPRLPVQLLSQRSPRALRNTSLRSMARRILRFPTKIPIPLFKRSPHKYIGTLAEGAGKTSRRDQESLSHFNSKDRAKSSPDEGIRRPRGAQTPQSLYY